MNSSTTETKSADVRLRLEPGLKSEASRVLADAGLELSIAIRLFLKQVVVEGGLPFEVRQPSATTLRAMKQAGAIEKARFGSAKELFNGLEGRPGKKRQAPAKKRLHKGIQKGLAKAPGRRA